MILPWNMGKYNVVFQKKFQQVVNQISHEFGERPVLWLVVIKLSFLSDPSSYWQTPSSALYIYVWRILFEWRHLYPNRSTPVAILLVSFSSFSFAACNISQHFILDMCFKILNNSLHASSTSQSVYCYVL